MKKVCTRCKLEKKADLQDIKKSDFYYNAYRSNFYCYCKVCNNEISNENRMKRLEKAKRNEEDPETVPRLEAMHMTEKRQKIYIALEDMNFFWCAKEVKHIAALWESGTSIKTIAQTFQREADELAVLIMDLARKGKISKREGGVFGV